MNTYFFKAPRVFIKAELPDDILPQKPWSAAHCPKTAPMLHEQPKADGREELSSAEDHDDKSEPLPTEQKERYSQTVTEQNTLENSLKPEDHWGNVKKSFFYNKN